MNTYQINNLTEDFEKKLSLYSQQNYMVRENNFFNIDRYTQYVNIIINAYDLDIQSMINRIENYNKSGIDFENGKLKFGYSDINMIASKLYKELWHQNNPNTLEAYINIIENRIDGDLSPWLDISFDDEDIKNNFLDSATEYIIEHQNIEWIKAFENIDYERYGWLRPIHDSDIPTAFENHNDLYFWLKNNRVEEILYFIGNSTVKLLLLNIIAIENYNPLYIHEYRIVKILKACKNDYITCGEILTHVSIKLNCILLTKFEYSLFAFLNLYNVHSTPNVSNENIDYAKEWQEMLANQLVNIFFKHFYNAYEKEKYSQIVFNLLNYLANQYVDQYNNTHHYKGNYTLSLVLEKLSLFKISISPYEKISPFNFCIEDLVALQLEELNQQKTFSKANYFLLSYYLKQIEIEKKIIDKDYSGLISDITQAIFDNLYYVINDESYNYIDYKFIDKIDFDLIYQLSSSHHAWLKILDIDNIEKVWKTILEERKEKSSFSSTDQREPKDKIELYFHILLIIFDKTEDHEVTKIINQLAIRFGLGFRLGIFMDFNITPKKLYAKYLEKLNLFDDDLFNAFLAELSKQNNLKNLLEFLSHTVSEVRRKSIEEKIEQVACQLDTKGTSYNDIRDSIAYAIDNGFRILATKLIDTYQAKIANTNYKQFQKAFAEVVCKKELLDIYYSDDSKDKKFNKLNEYAITFDDKGWGEHSKQVQCENYKDFVRAIMFFEDEPIKTYRILHSLLDRELNSLYLINMVSAYFKVYDSDIHKKEKYIDILNIYTDYEQKLHNHQKSLFEYQTLFDGYITVEDENKFTRLWQEMPRQYQHNFRILELRCEFLQQNKQSSQAKEYIREFKKICILTKDEKEKITKIEEKLNANIKIETENELKVKIDFQNNNLTLREAKNYWLQIKDMSSEEHAQIFSIKRNFNDFIVEIMLHISKELLNRKINVQRQIEQTLEIEDIINDWVTSLLTQKMSFLNWNVKDQTRGGPSSSGNNVGEKDLEVFDSTSNKLFLFEAFRLFSADTTKIQEHIDKLDGYNADGCQVLIVMVYTKVNNFPILATNYQQFLKNINYKGFDTLSSTKDHSFEVINSDSSTIKLLNEVRYKNSTEVNIYHFLLDFS
ncbi:MAG: hypothetical protein PHQ90_00875 [Sulfuricurvum sp.]|nr:hypothetical protein [Sulfuricurvum sp.]